MSNYIDAEKLIKFKEALADIIVSSQGICTYQDCKDIAEREALLLIATLQREQPEVDLEKVYDAYCKVCGHYHHTTPAYICRHACDYFKDFKALLNARKEEGK